MDDPEPWRDAVVTLLNRTRLSQPDTLPADVNAAVARIGLRMTLYLVDHEQRTLHAVPEPGREPDPPLDVESTEAGRAFMATEPVASTGPEGRRLWTPLLDGSERLGVLAVDGRGSVVDDDEFRAQCDMFAALVGHLVALKSAYGDRLLRTRRTGRMSVASELLWRIVPPLTYACERMILSVILEPCYDAGGDGFDYSIDSSLAHLALVDTSGHGLRAGLGAGVALSALRASRRAGGDLVAGGRAVDAAFAEQFGDSRFATAFLATLDLDTGLLSYVNAGHPPPLVVRAGRVVCRLDEGRRLPLGVVDPRAGAGSEVATVRLEHGDRLLCYTDGITEARSRDSAMFGEERLVALVERGGDAGLPAPEVLRRLSHAVLAHLDGPPTDDATLMLVEWSSAAARRILP